MSEPIDAEVVQTNAIALRPSMAVGQAMAVEEILAQVKLIQDVMRKVMVEKEHYGTIPGCGDKKVLLQPGAQKLTMTFRLAPEYQIQEVNLERGHKEYRIICTLKSMGSGAFVGQGVGCCSSMESKYRFRGGARKCPECGKEAIIMGKRFKPEDPEPGWLCWKKKDGCGATWHKDDPTIVSQSVEKVENENPADCFNTVLKMAKKRAFVDATITATAASDIFTQDIGDDGEPEDAETLPNAPRSAARSNLPAQPVASVPGASQSVPLAVSKPFPTKESLTKALEALKAGPGAPARAIVTEYFTKAGALLNPGEELEDLPLRFCPNTPGLLRAVGEAIADFEAGNEALLAFPPHAEPDDARKANASKSPEKERPRENGQQASDWFMDVIVPVPRKGQKRDEYLKAPDSIGSLFEARHEDTADGQEARQRLWGFVNNYEPKGWTRRDGTRLPASDGDKQFRVALDAFQEWFEKAHPGEKP